MTGKTVHRQAFDELAEWAEEELGEDLKKLVLFGSVAEGEATEDSDVDVFAVVKTPEQKERLQKKGARIGIEHGLMMTTVVRTEEEYEKMKDTPFGREIMETGEIIV